MGFGPKMTLQRQTFIPSFYVLCYFHSCIGSQTLKFDYIKVWGRVRSTITTSASETALGRSARGLISCDSRSVVESALDGHTDVLDEAAGMNTLILKPVGRQTPWISECCNIWLGPWIASLSTALPRSWSQISPGAWRWTWTSVWISAAWTLVFQWCFYIFFMKFYIPVDPTSCQ